MQYRTIGGDLAEMHPSITAERVSEAVYRRMTTLDNPGFCLDCGTEAHGCEPDARHYRCESCELRAVFGADEILLMLA
jgi:hypothetical protein